MPTVFLGSFLPKFRLRLCDCDENFEPYVRWIKSFGEELKSEMLADFDTRGCKLIIVVVALFPMQTLTVINSTSGQVQLIYLLQDAIESKHEVTKMGEHYVDNEWPEDDGWLGVDTISRQVKLKEKTYARYAFVGGH